MGVLIRRIKRLFKVLIYIILLILMATFAADQLVKQGAKERVFDSISEIPHNKVGLVLGTAKFLKGGQINLYYKYRIESAVKLYQCEKIDFILVSGDNSTKNYDEPSTIKADLVAEGIPAEKIYLDYAGFRTLDSIVRSRDVFGQENITVVSQKFHNERALYLAKQKGIDAIGFNAKDVDLKYGFKIQLREKLARVKMFLDLAFGKTPKFLGEEIEIE